MDKYLTDNEIIEIIKEYVDNSIYNYAVLIDGEWGCGKTYFIEKKLMSSIEKYEKEKSESAENYKSKKVIYISLYGLKRTEDISRMIYINAYDVLKKVDNKTVKTIVHHIGTGVRIASDVIKNYVGIDADNAIDNISENLDMKKFIIIFDDLERANCDINEILGYINNFVEHDNTKVIIVANEYEIGKSARQNNKELRYLVCTNTNIDYGDRGDIINLVDKKEEKTDKKISVDELKEKADILFEDVEVYKRIKEKLIGLTIRYYPDMNQVMKDLITKNIVNEKLKENLLKNVEWFVEFSKRKNHINLRTFLFYLSNIQKLCIVFSSDSYNEIIKSIIKYTYAISVLHKSGSYNIEWEEDSEYEQVPVDGKYNFKGYMLGFKFIDELILYGKFNAEYAKQTVDYYLKQLEESAKKPNDPCRKLEGWWEKKEEDVRVLMNELMDNLKNNQYLFNAYPDIVVKAINLVNCGFEKEFLEKIVEVMKENISNANGKVIFDEHSAMLLENDIKKQYRKIMAELKELAEEKNIDKAEENFDIMIADINKWGENLYNYVYNDRQMSLEDKSFVSKIDPEKILTKIELSDNYNLCQFRYAIYRIYDFSNIADYYQKDYKNLKLIYDGLDENNSYYDMIKKMNVRLLKGILKEKMELLAPE